MNRAGIFISFEGGEGSGKSTVANRLCAEIQKSGRLKAQVIREPGGDKISEELRALVRDPENRKEILDLTELLVFIASRAQFVPRVLIPALDKNDFVLCDRYVDSTEAYQGYGRGIDVRYINELNRLVTNGLMPVRTYLLDVEPAVGVDRAKKVEETRFEQEPLGLHERIRKGYLAIAQRDSERVVVINATEPDIDEVFRAIRKDFYLRFSEF